MSNRGPAALPFAVIGLVAAIASDAYAQSPGGGGEVWVPPSSREQPADIGKRAHGNLEVFVPRQGGAPPQPPYPVQPPQDAPAGASGGPASGR